MPDLLPDGASDSDSSQDARDVEMGIIPDDYDDDWVDEDEEALAPDYEAQAPDRRARVEDEVEPLSSQSVPTLNPAPPRRPYTDTERNQPFPTLPPRNPGPDTTQHGFGIPTPQPPRRLHTHTIHTFFMDGTGRPIPPQAFSPFYMQSDPATPRPQPQTPQPDQPPNHDQPGQPDDTGRARHFVNFINELRALAPPSVLPGLGPQPPSDGLGNGGIPEPGRRVPFWNVFVNTIFEGEPPEEKDDPERAKILVEGLEQVPVGLVRRMMRLDGIPGAREDLAGTDGGEVPGCAICWDSLLSEEPSKDVKPQLDPTTSAKSEHPTGGPDSEPAVSAPAPDDLNLNPIICLPCSHIFHSSCLIPWFSKPKHTTCPTCRFDIDPRSLTYTPPPRRPRSTPTQPVPNPMTANVDAPPHSPPVEHPEHVHEGFYPLNPLSTDERNDERDRHPFDIFLPIPAFPYAPLQQGPEQISGDALAEAPDNEHGIPRTIYGFALEPQQPVLDPRPPPGHPIHGIGSTATDAPQDHGNEPQHMPLPDGLHHVHNTHLDLAPTVGGLDPEIIFQFMQSLAAVTPGTFGLPVGGGRGPWIEEQTGPVPNPDGANLEPGVPREWVPPPAPGPTLRERVHARERKAGLRCHAPSCGIGPSDEVPFPEVFNDPNSPSVKRVSVLKNNGDDALCGHVLHPACLVSAYRCAGWEEGENYEYKVACCPVCRKVGRVRKEVWQEGVEELVM